MKQQNPGPTVTITIAQGIIRWDISNRRKENRTNLHNDAQTSIGDSWLGGTEEITGGPLGYLFTTCSSEQNLISHREHCSARQQAL